jgi:hypothetical protein
MSTRGQVTAHSRSLHLYAHTWVQREYKLQVRANVYSVVSSTSPMLVACYRCCLSSFVATLFSTLARACVRACVRASIVYMSKTLLAKLLSQTRSSKVATFNSWTKETFRKFTFPTNFICIPNSYDSRRTRWFQGNTQAFLYASSKPFGFLHFIADLLI